MNCSTGRTAADQAAAEASRSSLASALADAIADRRSLSLSAVPPVARSSPEQIAALRALSGDVLAAMILARRVDPALVGRVIEAAILLPGEADEPPELAANDASTAPALRRIGVDGFEFAGTAFEPRGTKDWRETAAEASRWAAFAAPQSVGEARRLARLAATPCLRALACALALHRVLEASRLLRWIALHRPRWTLFEAALDQARILEPTSGEVRLNLAIAAALYRDEE